MPLKVRKNRREAPQCPLTECMPLIGGVWTASILWYLAAGPRRFNELRSDLPGISAKVLSSQLRELRNRGVVHREEKPTSPPSVEYALTDAGQELIPALEVIIKVGKKLKLQ